MYMGGTLSCFYAILFPFSFAHYISLHLALVPMDELCIMHDLQWSGIACHVLIGATSSEPCGNTVHCPAALLSVVQAYCPLVKEASMISLVVSSNL